jgi:hypothetical protein
VAVVELAELPWPPPVETGVVDVVAVDVSVEDAEVDGVDVGDGEDGGGDAGAGVDDGVGVGAGWEAPPDGEEAPGALFNRFDNWVPLMQVP